MWSEVENKRNKFANDIRRKHHQQYFEVNRQWNGTQLPAIAYLPVLMQNQLYDDIESIMDCIEYQAGTDELNPTMIKQIREKQIEHTNEKVRLIMFQLLNRLDQWELSDVNKAIEMLKGGNQKMLKQLSLYLQMKFQQINQSNGNQCDKQKQLKKVKSSLKEIFDILVLGKWTNLEYRLFWLDVVARAVECLQQTADILSLHFQSITPMLDVQFKNCENEYEATRVMRIFSKIASKENVCEKIVELPCFIGLINSIMNESIEMIITWLEIIAQMMSNSEVVVFKMVHNFGIIETLSKFMDHVLIPIQIRVLWGLSNIAGSQQYTSILSRPQIMQKIFIRANHETIMPIRKQLYFCILNLISNSNNTELAQLVTKYKSIQLLYDIVNDVSQPDLKPLFFERTLFAIYHLIIQYGRSILQLQQMGIRKIITSWHDIETNQQRVSKIDTLLNAMQKASEHENGKQQISSQQIL